MTDTSPSIESTALPHSATPGHSTPLAAQDCAVCGRRIEWCGEDDCVPSLKDRATLYARTFVCAECREPRP